MNIRIFFVNVRSQGKQGHYSNNVFNVNAIQHFIIN